MCLYLFKGSEDQYMPGVSSYLADESFGDDEPTLTPILGLSSDPFASAFMRARWVPLTRQAAFSKLPVRQLTFFNFSLTKFCFSKLPVRQLTCHWCKSSYSLLSKLPVRQLTCKT